jgi:UDP-N-acetylmuramoylalanine--D-glutamate ligase
MTADIRGPVLVAGVGVSGRAAALELSRRGIAVKVVDAADDQRARSRAAELLAAGVEVHLGGASPALAEPARLVVTSPGWRPDHPLLVSAARLGAEVVGEVELAWRLRPDGAGRWLAVTGTNGKTTTTRMAERMLAAAGRRVLAAGNVGLPAVEAVLSQPPPEFLVVELSSFQLHWSSSIRPFAAAILNLAEDHLDWHGSFGAYAGAKERIWAGDVAVGNRDDPEVFARLGRAPGRRVAFTLSAPEPGELGLLGTRLVDRAFGADEVLADVADVPLPGPHHVANALAAAALVRSVGVAAPAVREGLRSLAVDPHRGDLVATIDGVAYVDDSKATNPHAALASLLAHRRVVWIVGGLLKGADLSPTVTAARDRLAAAVVVGVDRGPVVDALARHAPGLPVVEVTATDTGAMLEAVDRAAEIAVRGDTVLLAPAAASMDIFGDYAERGDAFVAAVEGRRG